MANLTIMHKCDSSSGLATVWLALSIVCTGLESGESGAIFTLAMEIQGQRHQNNDSIDTSSGRV